MSGDLLNQFCSLSLSEAVLCANCDMISNSGTECLCCGSTATMPLAKLLGALAGGSTAKIIEHDFTKAAPKVVPQRAA